MPWSITDGTLEKRVLELLLEWHWGPHSGPHFADLGSHPGLPLSDSGPGQAWSWRLTRIRHACLMTERVRITNWGQMVVPGSPGPGLCCTDGETEAQTEEERDRVTLTG